MKNKSCYSVLKWIFIAILLIFTCSIPVCYGIQVYADKLASIDPSNIRWAYFYIAVRVLRLLCVIAAGYMIRKKNRDILTSHTVQRKHFSIFILGFAGVSWWLYIDKTLPELHANLSNMVGYFSHTWSLFASIWWMEFFSFDFYWCCVLCFAIVFFHIPRKVESQ